MLRTFEVTGFNFCHITVLRTLFSFIKPLFLQNRDTYVKNNCGISNFDLCRTFLVKKHYCAVKDDAQDASGFKIPAKMVLDPDVSPKH